MFAFYGKIKNGQLAPEFFVTNLSTRTTLMSGGSCDPLSSLDEEISGEAISLSGVIVRKLDPVRNAVRQAALPGDHLAVMGAKVFDGIRKLLANEQKRTLQKIKADIASKIQQRMEHSGAKGRNQTLTTEAQRTQSQELILPAAEAADSILHGASRHGEYLFFSVASVPLWFN